MLPCIWDIDLSFDGFTAAFDRVGFVDHDDVVAAADAFDVCVFGGIILRE